MLSINAVAAKHKLSHSTIMSNLLYCVLDGYDVNTDAFKIGPLLRQNVADQMQKKDDGGFNYHGSYSGPGTVRTHGQLEKSAERTLGYRLHADGRGSQLDTRDQIRVLAALYRIKQAKPLASADDVDAPVAA